MTGYNHYPNCTCGWCANYGGSRLDRSKLTDTFRYRDARLLLKQSGANSVSGCYVNSNARCPVCSAAVFFYANAAGSRVYFDDLGPPWPKHPCTDGPRGSRTFSKESYPPPTRRSRGQVKELLAAANMAGFSRSKVFGQRRTDEWSLVVIHTVDRQGENNRVEGEYLDSETGEPFQFNCRSKVPLFEVGEFISVNGTQISFVDKETLRPVLFNSGDFVELSANLVTETAKTPSSTIRLRATSQPAKLVRKQEAIKRGIGKYDMKKAEMVHFDNKKVSLAELFAKLEPVIKMYARDGVRKPKEVARRLNAEGYRTASDSNWTTRLVFFLLALMFNGNGTDTEDPEVSAKPRSVKPDHPRGPLPTISADDMNADTIAERLSLFGRVVRKTTN